jgi:hypothetical protein
MKAFKPALRSLNPSLDFSNTQTLSSAKPWASAMLLVASLLIGACSGGGGSGSSESTIQTGQFIDSAVEGVTYTTPTQSGTTDSDGNFTYLSGEVVSFYIGDILIGSAVGDAQLTPLDFVPGAVDETDQQVTNILRFVQSLDSDSDPSNGITISSMVATQALGQVLDFTLVTVDFETAANALVSMLTSGVVTEMVDASAAQAHFTGTVGGSSPSGTLTLSGTDTALFGTDFTPDPLLTSPSPVFIQWHQDFPDTSFLEAAVIINGVGDITDVLFTWQLGATAAAYAISCTVSNPGGFYPLGDCSQMGLDTTAGQVTFDVTIDQSFFGPAATAPITLNGVLDF